MSLLTAPFWAVNLLIEGARATDEAAAAAATRILQKNVESRIQIYVYTQVHMHIVSILRFQVLPFMDINVLIRLIDNLLLHHKREIHEFKYKGMDFEIR